MKEFKTVLNVKKPAQGFGVSEQRTTTPRVMIPISSLAQIGSPTKNALRNHDRKQPCSTLSKSSQLFGGGSKLPSIKNCTKCILLGQIKNQITILL